MGLTDHEKAIQLGEISSGLLVVAKRPTNSTAKNWGGRYGADVILDARVRLNTRNKMASFAEAPAGDAAKGECPRVQSIAVPPAIATRVRSRPPSLPNHHLTPVIPPRRRRQDFQDQVRAVPRGRVRRRSQAGAFDLRNARTRRSARSPSILAHRADGTGRKISKNPPRLQKRVCAPVKNHVGID